MTSISSVRVRMRCAPVTRAQVRTVPGERDDLLHVVAQELQVRLPDMVEQNRGNAPAHRDDISEAPDLAEPFDAPAPRPLGPTEVRAVPAAG